MPFVLSTFLSIMRIKIITAIEAGSTGSALPLSDGVVNGSSLIVAAKVGNSAKTPSTAWFAAEEKFLLLRLESGRGTSAIPSSRTGDPMTRRARRILAHNIL